MNYAQTKKICYTSCETYVKNPASGTIERRHLLFLVVVQIVVLVIVIMITEHLRRKIYWNIEFYSLNRWYEWTKYIACDVKRNGKTKI